MSGFHPVASTVSEAAAFALRLTRGTVDPETLAGNVGENYRVNAATMREYADRARRAKSGKYRGYTEAHALEAAAECDARAESVPAEIRRIASETP